MCVCVCVCVLVTQLYLTLCNPKDAPQQAPLSLGVSRQEYWSGLLFSSPGDLPDSGTVSKSNALHEASLPSEPSEALEVRYTPLFELLLRWPILLL